MVIAVPVLRTSNVNRSDGTNYATQESAHRESSAQRAFYRLPRCKAPARPRRAMAGTAAPVSGRFVPVSTPNGIGIGRIADGSRPPNATHTRPLLLGMTPAAALNPAVPCTARSSALGVRGASASLARWLSTCRMPRTLGARSRSAGRMCSTRTVRPRSVVRRRGVMRGSARGAVYADGDRGAGVVSPIAANDVGRNTAARRRLSSRTRSATTSGALAPAALAPSARGRPRGNSLLRCPQRYPTPSSISSR